MRNHERGVGLGGGETSAATRAMDASARTALALVGRRVERGMGDATTSHGQAMIDARGGFANAALAIGAFVCLYGALALSFRVSLMRPAALDGPVVLSAAAVSGGGRHPRGTRSNPRLPPAFPTKSENSLDEQLLHYDGSAESSAYTS